jgi:DNA-binding transcriptional MerR regulator
MASRRTYQVKKVARLAGLSIRALHHYDSIGLLVPSARSDAGYRLYDDDDLLRLQQILIGRELGLPLEDIRRALDDPAFDVRKELLAQRQQLERRARQTAAMIAAVDAALALVAKPGEEGGMDRIFEGFTVSKFEAEAQQRWGETDAYKEAARRTKGYTKEDWTRQHAEAHALYSDAAALMKAGRVATDTEVLDIAERHRLLIDRWFYPCSPEMHQGLASLYESDARFTEAIDAHAPGLSTFLVAAIRANAERGSRE